MYTARSATFAFILGVAGMVPAQHSAATSTTEPSAGGEIALNIAAQPMPQALAALAAQTGMQMIFRSTEIARNLDAPEIIGRYTPRAALKMLLSDSGLREEWINERTVAIRPAEHSERPSASGAPDASSTHRMNSLMLAQAGSAEAQTESGKEGDGAVSRDANKGTPEILVKGNRSLNADIERSEDAPQPYVVFDREEIARSQAVDLEDFLRTRLPMNTTPARSGQSPGDSTNLSRIDLRGLGANQTLILVDGRRMPGTASGGIPDQPDINGIPLAAVERIEVLPSTASGIYGGSATGGVVNVILRRDYRGMEAKITYGNTFDAKADSMRLDATGGFSLEGGRTQVMIAAAYADSGNLTVGERDFAQRAIYLTDDNNEAAFPGAFLPPVGNTVNIRSTTGAPLQLDDAYGAALLSDSYTYVPLGYAGPGSDNGAALVANSGNYNLQLPNDLNGNNRGLFAAPSMKSISFNVRREFSQRVEAFVDLSSFTHEGSSYYAAVPSSAALPASAPNNPFQQNIYVSFPTPNLSFENYSDSATVRATGGVIVRLPRRWTGEIDYGWSRSRWKHVGGFSVLDGAGMGALSSGLPAADGRPALNILQEGNTFPIDFTPYLLPFPNTFRGPYDTILKDTTLRFSGPAAELSGGPLSLSVLVERRDEVIDDAIRQDFNPFLGAPRYFFYPNRSQSVDSYYLEARAPLISSGNAFSGVQALELQASVRHDRYRTRGVPDAANLMLLSLEGPYPPVVYSTNRVSSTDYTLGVRYSPSEDLTLRASFGTGFLPPSVTQLASSSYDFGFSLGLTDPLRGDTDTYVGEPWTYIDGGNAGLKPEESESWSAGFILTPRFSPGLRLSIDYTRIDKVDEIQTPALQFVIDNADTLAGRVMRGANLPGDDPSWAGPITSLDATLLNIAQTSLEAFDIQFDYTVQAGTYGEFRGYALATWQPDYRNQVFPADPVVDSVGYIGGPLEWRGNVGLDWTRGPLRLSWNMQYYDSYFVYFATSSPGTINSRTLNQGSPTIPSQRYHDLIATYRFGDAGTSEISFGIQNLLDTSPPIVATTSAGSEGYSTYGDPRLRRFSISFRKAFGAP